MIESFNCPNCGAPINGDLCPLRDILEQTKREVVKEQFMEKLEESLEETE